MKYILSKARFMSTLVKNALAYIHDKQKHECLLTLCKVTAEKVPSSYSRFYVRTQVDSFNKRKVGLNRVYLSLVTFSHHSLHILYHRTTCFGQTRPSSGLLCVTIHKSLNFTCKYNLYYHLLKFLNFVKICFSFHCR
jgi:hypothetical protein